MKKKVRFGVFETNSSSTHVLTICTKEMYEKFVKGELFFDTRQELLISQEDIPNAITNYNKERRWSGDISQEDYMDYYVESYDRFIDSDYATFTREYKSPSGDDIVVVGRYGDSN